MRGESEEEPADQEIGVPRKRRVTESPPWERHSPEWLA